MRSRNFLLIALAILVVFGLGFALSTASAAPPVTVNDATLPNEGGTFSNEACLACHENPQFSITLTDGSQYGLFVDPDAYAHSVHGANGYLCVQCHVDFKPEMGHGFSFNSRREATLTLNETCGQCHYEQAALESDSAHAAARDVGNLEAAICSDCHTAHTVQRLTDPNSGELLPEMRAWIPATCQQCHSAIYEKYASSVHGAALVGEGNPDVPTCIDCHGVHIIEDPTTTAFRLSSPQMCAKCHTDPQVMNKYGLSIQVLSTYVADFHGTTVTIFDQVSPDAETNKPVCYDCHGIHDITRVDDPQKGLQVKENLLIRCQACHEEATPNFPDAWMSHYIPSPEKYPIVYYIDLFYKFLIPAVLIPMGILVVMDFGRMMINRFRKPRPHEASEKHEEITPPVAAEDDAGNDIQHQPVRDEQGGEMRLETESDEKSAEVETPEQEAETVEAEETAEAQNDTPSIAQEVGEPDEADEESPGDTQANNEEPRHE